MVTILFSYFNKKRKLKYLEQDYPVLVKNGASY